MSKVKVQITLYLSEIVYHIQNKTHLAGESAEGDGNFKQVADLQANMDDRNLNQVLRFVTSAANALRTKMAEFIETGPEFSANDIQQDYDETTTLTYTLLMPTNYDASTKDDIATAAHDYVVNYAVAQWLAIKRPELSATYTQYATTNLLELRSALYKRKAPVRPYVAGGVRIEVSPREIDAVYDEDNEQAFEVAIRVFNKSEQVPVGTGSDTSSYALSAILNSEISSSGSIVTDSLNYTMTSTTYSTILGLSLIERCKVNMAIPIKITYGGVEYERTIHFTTNE